jgi:hypothetical protein
MQQNFQITKVAGTATDAGGAKTWTNPSNAKVEDGNLATCSNVGPGGGGGSPNQLNLTNFAFNLPDFAVVDGIAARMKVQTTGGVSGDDAGRVYLLYNGGSTSPSNTPNYGIAWTSTLNWITHGDTNAELWGRQWTPSEINNSAFGVSIAAMPGTGTANINVDSVEITVYWHIDISAPQSDVPTRFDYKVYSRDGDYLGLLPKVTSKFGFAQDINSAGSSIVITCGQFVKNEVNVSPLLTEGGDVITTEDDVPILATSTDLLVTTGASPDNAIFKNSNRLKVYMYNRYYPNGKLVFSGQINRVNLKYGGDDTQVSLTVYSDGVDLNNLIARGYPFSYTTDVTQSSQNGYVTNIVNGPKDAGWDIYGQTWLSGAITNIGQIVLKLGGTADVTLNVYDAPNGNLVASITKAVSVAITGVDVEFNMAQLVNIEPNTQYFIVPWVAQGQSIRVYRHSSSSTYANGSMYYSNYSGGSGGGAFSQTTGDFYFITKYGTPTTTTTYSSDDPVTDMASDILLDYNSRGGYITERDFDATGLSLTYTFVVATVLDALKKILELCPSGYYYYIDLGSAEIDIKQTSSVADFTVVRGRHIAELDLGLTIEQVKNYLLFSGGDTGGGTNLYKQYQDNQSSAFYGLRTATKSDNRVTLTATADAVGDSFIEENSDEVQETTLTVKDEHVDITQFTPGKTIGFRNFGNFIDDMVLQIVRREVNFSDGTALLTLGRLPLRLPDEIQRINRELLNEQTISNPSSPS